MKMKAKLLISAVALGMALPLALPVVANAADADPAATADKSASVTVTGGDLSFGTDANSGGIEAPSFQFAGKVSSTSQTLTNPTFGDVKNTSDKYASSNLAVDDETGTGNGWDVTAKLGTFTGVKNKAQSLGATLNMVTTTPQAGEEATTATSTPLVAGSTSATKVFSAASTKGMGTATADFAKSTLTLPTAAYADSYTADLTYELTAGPTA